MFLQRTRPPDDRLFPSNLLPLARHAPESLVLCEGGLDRLQNLGEMVGQYGKTYKHMYLSVEMLGKRIE